MTAKKTTFRQPPVAEVDAWVTQEATAPDPAAKPVRQAAGETNEKLARLTLDLPGDLHARFKAKCAIKRTKMQIELRKFVEAWTREDA